MIYWLCEVNKLSKQYHKVRVTVTLDPEIHKFIETIAKKDDRTVSYLVNKILIEYVKTNNNP